MGQYKKNLYLFLGSVFCVLWLSCSPKVSIHSGWDKLPQILERIVIPQFPSQTVNVLDFGAVGDGKTDCTEAFRKAILACHTIGGGKVVVPEGKYLTGPIHLRSRVVLHLEKNAVILFTRDIQKYLPLVLTRFEGVELMNYSPCIYAYGQENVAITGEGILDAQADSTGWWSWVAKEKFGWKPGMPHQEKDRDSLFQMAEKKIPVEKRRFGPGHFLRVNFIQFYRCKNVLIEGVTILRSPMWVIHPVLCENVIVQNVHVQSLGPNNDGCNPESSKNVWIRNCEFDTGDDCIAIKSGRNGDGRRIHTPSENIVIQHCVMKSGHGGVVIGSEISGNCRNVFIEDCFMEGPNLDMALRIKTNSLRGGIVENVYARHITIKELTDSVIWIDFYYGEGDIAHYTPVVRNLYVSDLVSYKSNYALFLQGYERSPIENVHLENCLFYSVEKGNWLHHVSGLRMENVKIQRTGREMTYAY